MLQYEKPKNKKIIDNYPSDPALGSALDAVMALAWVLVMVDALALPSGFQSDLALDSLSELHSVAALVPASDPVSDPVSVLLFSEISLRKFSQHNM